MPVNRWFGLVIIAILSSLIIIYVELLKDVVGEIVTFILLTTFLTFVFIVSIITGLKLSFRDDVYLDPKHKKDTH